MPETFESHPKASVSAEAFGFKRGENDDIDWALERLNLGFSTDVENAISQALALKEIAYDEFIPQENDARDHIEKAIELFVESYRLSVPHTVDKLNQILAEYPGVVRLDGRVVVSVEAQWQADGRAELLFNR